METSKLLLGKLRKDTRLIPIRTLSGDAATMQMPATIAPYGAQTKDNMRYTVDLVFTDAAVTKALEELDAWASNELKSRSDLEYLPCLKRREGRPPKLRTKFTTAGQMPIRCWTPEHETIELRDMAWTNNVLIPVLHIRGIWLNMGKAGLLFEMTDVVAESNRTEWPFEGL